MISKGFWVTLMLICLQMRKKDSFAAHRLLTHTEGVMNAALAQYRNVDLVLAQIAEWGDIVSRFITY